MLSTTQILEIFLILFIKNNYGFKTTHQADTYEANCYMGSKFKPEYTKRKLKDKFPDLTEAQVKHILRII